MKGFHTNIEHDVTANIDFRKVIFTGEKSQIVVMTIPPHSEIGEEVHEHVEQTLCFMEGEGIAVLDHVEYAVKAHDLVVVPPKTRHNFINTGEVPLKLFTVYAPPNHIDGRVHHSIVDAESDQADEAVGK